MRYLIGSAAVAIFAAPWIVQAVTLFETVAATLAGIAS